MTSHTASVTSYGTPLRLLLAWLGVGGRGGAGVGGRGGFCFPVRGKILSLLGGTAMHAAAACGREERGIKGTATTALAGGSDMEGNE